MEQETILKMSNITMSFAGNKVLKDVCFDLKKGEIHSLVGHNGAGKSTLIKILNGIYKADSGDVEINGEKVKLNNPHDAKKYSMAFVHQELNLCDWLSIAENIFMGNLTKKHGFFDKAGIQKKAKEILEKMGVELDPNIMVKDLRNAEKQIVEITKALTYNAKILILDEPTSSLNENEKDMFFKIIGNLKNQGVSCILISHFIEDVVGISDRVTVLKDGLNNGEFSGSQITKDNIIMAMMGQKIEKAVYKDNCELEKTPVVLEVKDIFSKKKLNHISFELHEGDILGVSGLLGAGKTEIARAVYGLDKIDSGEIIYYGKRIKNPKPKDLVKKKVVMLSEDRKLEGYVPLLTLRENLTLSIMNTLKNKIGTIDKKKQAKKAESLADEFSVKRSSNEQQFRSLSGGNQQKAIIARCLATNPKIFILDEPTRGVDVLAKNEIYKILHDAAEKGTAILVLSSELEELLDNCKDIIVLKRGKIIDKIEAHKYTKNDLMQLIS